MTYRFKKHQPKALIKNHLNLGGKNPSGGSIEVTNKYIERDGRPWIGVMGEYHFSRDGRENWYRELAKMKAGGITVVSTYLFWIYHEEIEGELDFTGDNDIRTFVKTASELGLDVFIRIGPWAHGECRNGGFPDWILKKPFKLRDNNDEYISLVRRWYGAIHDRLKGLFYCEGGNIIGVQLENELVDNAEHLARLKNLAVELGFDVPLYTVTGWNSRYGAKIPVDEVMPVFGGYVDAPWAESLEQLPPSPHYVFNTMRNDSAIGVDMIAAADDDGWQLPYEKYPFATCELGCGIQPSHHRRMIVSGIDTYALSLVKLGGGNNLIGYYMYHGGINKVGKLSSFNESRATGYPNDYPVLSYFCHTALTPYGEAKEQYGMLNLLHLFAEDFGEILAPMETVESVITVLPEDRTSLRYAMRTDGKSGFVFINNYQRLHVLSDKDDSVINTGEVTFPPIDIKNGVSFFMPFNMRAGDRIIEYATAQQLCIVDDTYFFVGIEGIIPQYKIKSCEPVAVKTADGISVDVINGVKIATIDFDKAKYLRRLNGEIFIGDKCNLYYENDILSAVENGRFSYLKWNGNTFDKFSAGEEIENAVLTYEDVLCVPFELQYKEELNLGGERKLTFKKIEVSSDKGFVEIPFECDVIQIYADGKMAADEYYCGVPWRIPAAMLYGRECYAVMSELKDDFYREF